MRAGAWEPSSARAFRHTCLRRVLRSVGYKETWGSHSPPASMLICKGARKRIFFRSGSHGPFLAGERSGLRSVIWELLQTPEQPSEQAIDPSLFSLSKGPSLIDYTVTPPAWDVDLEFALAEWHNFPRKGDEGCFCFPIACTLVVRVLLAGEKCRAQSHWMRRAWSLGLLSHYWINSELVSGVFFVFLFRQTYRFLSRNFLRLPRGNKAYVRLQGIALNLLKHTAWGAQPWAAARQMRLERATGRIDESLFHSFRILHLKYCHLHDNLAVSNLYFWEHCSHILLGDHLCRSWYWQPEP